MWPNNGLEALAALERQPYDLVLMDIQMPEMDGMEATAEIRNRWPQAQQPRIVAMTADVLQEEIDSCQRAGMDGYVAKPIHVPDLVAALKNSWAAIHAAGGFESTEAAPDSILVDGPTSPDDVAKPMAESGPADDKTGAILDPEAVDRLLRVVANDRDVLRLLIDSFLEDAPGLLETMQRAARDQDAENLRRSAHTLKSNSADFGATELADLCKQLEDRAKQGDLGEADGLTEEIVAAYEPVAAALKILKEE